MYEYNAIVTKVHDGDTITVDVDLGWNVWRKGESLRLFGLNAPELNTTEGKVAQVYLSKLLPLGCPVMVKTEKDKTEKYGRMLATVTVAGLSVCVNDVLLAKGYAKPWDGTGVRPT